MNTGKLGRTQLYCVNTKFKTSNKSTVMEISWLPVEYEQGRNRLQISVCVGSSNLLSFFIYVIL